MSSRFFKNKDTGLCLDTDYKGNIFTSKCNWTESQKWALNNNYVVSGFSISTWKDLDYVAVLNKTDNSIYMSEMVESNIFMYWFYSHPDNDKSESAFFNKGINNPKTCLTNKGSDIFATLCNDGYADNQIWTGYLDEIEF